MDRSEDQEAVAPLVGLNQFREMLYLFLSRAFSKEADRAFLRNASDILNSLEYLSDLGDGTQGDDIEKGQRLLREFFKEIEGEEQEDVLTDLSRNYAALFLGVGEKTVALCESVYVGGTGSLFQESYFEAKERYAGIGMRKSDGFAEPEDHLSLELAYMATLCRLMIECGEDHTTQIHHLKAQLEFLRKHLVPWAPALLRRLHEVKASGFYQAWGYILNGYVNVDRTLVDSLVRDLESEYGAL